MVNRAQTDHPVHELIAGRWSPYEFDADRDVSDADLCALLEAARWAASSYNEQPWRFVVARRADAEEFERLLSCLVEANQAWARNAGALLLGVTRLTFVRNGKPNRHAQHDLGLALGNLSLEATARGLAVHQMAGFSPERARELYAVPDDAEPMTAIAVGYTVDGSTRDTAPRQRKPLTEIVFSGTWGRSAPLVG